MALEQIALIDGKGGNADASQRKMVGAVVVAGHGCRIGQQRQVEGFGDRLHGGPEVDALGAAQAHRAGNADGQQHVVVEIERDLRRREPADACPEIASRAGPAPRR